MFSHLESQAVSRYGQRVVPVLTSTLLTLHDHAHLLPSFFRDGDSRAIGMRKPGEIAKFIMPRLTTLFRWRTGFLVLLTFLILTTLWRLHTTEPTIYKQYLQSHISKYLEAGRWAYENTLHNEDTKDAVHKSFNFSSPCENFPDTRGILLVMKTGATEAHAKLPTHLVTDLQCLPDLLLFSDLVSTIFGVQQFCLSTDGQLCRIPCMRFRLSSKSRG